jgi:hypothetical protein
MTNTTVITGTGSTTYEVVTGATSASYTVGSGFRGPVGATGATGPAGSSAWNDLTGTADLVPFTTLGEGPALTGEMAWDAEEETVALLLKNTTLVHLGEDVMYHVENVTGTEIAKGTAVAYSGSVGASGKLRVKPWNGSTDAPLLFMGIAPSNIPNGGTGYVMHFGKIKGINTNAFTAGSILYANPTGTGLTQTQPTSGTFVIAAVCVSSANNGTLIIRPERDMAALSGDISTTQGGTVTTLASTIAGAKTLSGQLQLTGQSATDTNSAMTRGLVGDYSHFSRDLFRDIVLNAVNTGAVVRRNSALQGAFDGDISTLGVNGSYVRGLLVGGSIDNYFDSASAVSFSRRWTLFTKVALNLPTNVQFHLGVGVDATTGIPSSGTNIGFQFTANNSVRLWRCNGGAATFSTAGAVTNLPTAYPYTGFHYIWLECVGNGTINLYVAYAAFGSGPMVRPATALCTLSGVGASASARVISSFLYATGTPAGFVSCVIGDARFLEY